MAYSCVLGKGPANPGIGGARSRTSVLNATNRWLPSSTLDALQTLRILLPRCPSPHRWAGPSDLGRSDLANHVGGQAAEPPVVVPLPDRVPGRAQLPGSAPLPEAPSRTAEAGRGRSRPSFQRFRQWQCFTVAST